MVAVSGLARIAKTVRRMMDPRAHPAIDQIMVIAGRSQTIRFEAAPLDDWDLDGGWPFNVVKGEHLYLVQPGNGRKFRTTSPRTALSISGGERLVLHSRTPSPLPRGCQFWIFTYQGGQFVDRAALNLWEPVARTILDLPPGEVQLCFALRLAGVGFYHPADVELSIVGEAFAQGPASPGGEADMRHHVEACLKTGRLAQALQGLSVAAPLDQWPTERLRLRARTLTALGRHHDAVEAWAAAAGQYASVADIPVEHLKSQAAARVLLAENGAGQAPTAERPIPPSPEVGDAEAYAGLGLREEARRRLEIAAESGDDRINALWALVRLEARAGRPDAALAHLGRLADLTAADPDGAWLEPALLLQAGHDEAARGAVDQALATAPSDTLFAIAANLARTEIERLSWLNRIMTGHGLATLLSDDASPLTGIDALTTQGLPQVDGPLVSVVVPTFNAQTTLETALRSLASQTWVNLEILVVDDASTDGSVALARTFADRDPRVRVIENRDNRGPYACRNQGLAQARGDYVTCQDADDWSHPERIHRQVDHLQRHPGLIANLSRCVTTTPELVCTPRSASLSPFRWNLSSLMLRRAPVLEAAGYWQEVRFAGDGEYIARLEAIFGTGAVGYLASGPLAVIRQTGSSLTAIAGGGVTQLGHTARQEYRERYRHRLEQGSAAPLACHAPVPPLAAPPAMLSTRSAEPVFDVIIASDFCLPGGTTASNIQEILAQRAAGLRTGLLQMHGYRRSVRRSISPKVRALIDDDMVQLITADQSVSASLLIIRWPPVLSSKNEGIASVRADRVVIVANQTPLRSDDPQAQAAYDPVVCNEIARLSFGKTPVWAPIGPTVRQALGGWAQSLDIAEADWINVIDAGQWPARSRSRRSGAAPVIGRHARDAIGKWPADPAQLLAAYPRDGSLDVHILGGAEVAGEILGRVPPAWTVHEFDAVSPADFLSGLDYFVYFPDPTLNEAFGRTVVEAMAAGVPVILPYRFEALFGDAAWYGDPADVKRLIAELEADPTRREALMTAGADFVQRHGHHKHLERLAPFGVTAAR